MHKNNYSLLASLLLTLLVSFSSLSASKNPDSTTYQAITASNNNIDISELEFALMPLTKAEVAIEVDAWLRLLKEKATIVSEAEILVSKKQKRIRVAQEISDLSTDRALLLQKSKADKAAAEQLKNDLIEINALTKSLGNKKAQQAVNTLIDTPDKLEDLAEKAEVYSDKIHQRRDLLIKNLTLLRSDKNDTLKRFKLVLSNWESKGGDAKELYLYADALAGTTVDLTDSSAAWLTIKGWSMSQDGGLRWLANIVKFLISICIVYILSRAAGKLADAGLSRNKNLSTLLKDFIKISIRRIILIIGYIVSLTLIEINVGPVLALIGAAGLVVGLALQSTLSNFASGMLILIYRPFDVGDIIEIDGSIGTVDSMTLLTTAIKSFDNQHLIIPNNNVWGSTIVNVTGSKTRRVDLIFSIGYSDDMAKAEKIMHEVVAQHKLILKLPEPTIKVNELAESSVNFICRPWVKTSDYLSVYWDITRQVKEEFDKQGVSIPFPQRDIHIHQSPKELT